MAERNESASKIQHPLAVTRTELVWEGAFHNEWQTCRSRNEPKLDLETRHTYDALGEYTVVVKVIDILGNDTTKTGTWSGCKCSMPRNVWRTRAAWITP
jgi:hypothetical protein